MTSRSLEEHRSDVLARLSPLAPLDLVLADAMGCVLAQDMVARTDVPALPIAAWDGFAVRSGDLRGARMRPVSLPVTHDVLPGHGPTRLMPGTVARIARGGALPYGADAVVARPTEADTALFLDVEAEVGEGVVDAGGHWKAGDVVVAADTVLGAGHVASLAACGYATARVFPSPRVAVIAVGSELRGNAGSKHPSLAPAQPTIDASGPLLAALLTSAGARVVRTLAVPDDAPMLRTAVADAALQADLVVTLGGVSDDWHDVVGPLLRHAYGGELHQVRLMPGDRQGVGTVGDGDAHAVPLLALPGNPVDVAAAFAGYGIDAITRMRGLEVERHTVTVEKGWRAPFGFAQVVPVQRAHGSTHAVVPVGDPASPLLRDIAAADGVALVAEEIVEVNEGDSLPILWWRR
ncbi:molybdopterin molybdotransferase MoeA [Demequina sp. TTPB684]|uniref:molybdopterin molybdotransferase MoeA n=1 Tax=unclassified Demequina TaxID=2620311 RepID=UPI001CF4BB50|nr:gephyrin-like molybdotransferase Glp [Demequina sp. TMPB413]MCB2412430.1 molybdopterin molybdotransferase MoeA [Demequina sp. TTPB684]UPU87414.1 molybdopterin molybdotransferase MoeA [Demequina sp. TMPB413]